MSSEKPTLIPFNQLVRSPKNVRRQKRSRNIEALAASIAVQGVLQNLVVSPADGGTYAVDAGDRRWQAIGLLIQQGKRPADFKVPCKIVDAGAATAASLAENVMREAMHPADEFDAFMQLTNEGHTVDFIADAFGVTPLVVERRLKLANAAPDLLTAFREDELTTDQLIALCATEDHARQVEVWKGSKGYQWMTTPKALRKAVLAESEIDVSNDPRIPFIGGLDVYRQAGGDVRRDLFTGDGSGGFITDEALLGRLVADKLDETAAQVRAEGWGWVELWPEFDWQSFHRLGRAPKSEGPLPDDVRAKIEALESENAKLDEEQEAIQERPGEYSAEDSERLDEIWERMQEITDAIEALTEAHATYAPDVLAKSGAIVALEEGELRIERGMVKTADRKAVVAAAGDADAIKGGRETESAGRKADAVSDALRRSLLGHRNLAVQVAVSQKPDAAKLLLAVWAVQEIRTALDRGFGRNDVPTDLTISGNYGGGTRTYHPITDEDGKAKEAAFNDACAAAVLDLPKADGKLWDTLAEKSGEELDKLIAFGIARSVSVTEAHQGFTAKLLETLGFDIAEQFTPTAENYLGRVSKPLMVEALTEAGKINGAVDKTALLAMKKGVLATEAETRLAGTGWVPKGIRTPKPKRAKPAAPKVAAKAKAPAKAKPKAPATRKAKAA